MTRHLYGVAAHEAGHAVAAVLLGVGVTYATIKPSGRLRGHVRYSSAGARVDTETKRWVHLQVASAGCVGEQLITGRVQIDYAAEPDLAASVSPPGDDAEGDLSTAPSDVDVVTSLASNRASDPGSVDGAAAGSELWEILEAGDSVRALLRSNRAVLEAVAYALWENETLSGQQILELMGVTSVSPPRASMNLNVRPGCNAISNPARYSVALRERLRSLSRSTLLSSVAPLRSRYAS